MKTRFGIDLERAGQALYVRQAHQQHMRADWTALPHAIKEEYCLWAADVLRAIKAPTGEVIREFPMYDSEAPVNLVLKAWSAAIAKIIHDPKAETKPS